MYRMTSVSITGSRLAMFGTVQTGVPDRIFLIVWDWKSGQVLFVRQILPKIWQAKLKHSHRISERSAAPVWSSLMIIGYCLRWGQHRIHHHPLR